MTPEEHRAYSKQYRADGYGANADARYRERWRDKVREKNRERMRQKRRDARLTRKGSIRDCLLKD